MKINKILQTQGYIFLVFVLMIGIGGLIDEAWAVLGGIGFIFQAGITFLIGIVQLLTKNENAKYYFLSMLLILLIGFSLCGVWLEYNPLNFH
jgi:hypothetical protein